MTRNDHLARMLEAIDQAVSGCLPTEADVVRLALHVEAVGNAMEGDVPGCVRSLVRSFAIDLETLAFMNSSATVGEALEHAVARYRQALEACLSTRDMTAT